MKKILMSMLVMAFSGMVNNATRHKREAYMDVTKLKMSLMYVKSIETFRLLFLSLMGVGGCLILVLTGVTLLHTTIFSYTGWTNETKLWVGLGLSLAYLLAAYQISRSIFAQDKWVKIFHASDMVDRLADRARQGDNGQQN